jgi:hypothetical protein
MSQLNILNHGAVTAHNLALPVFILDEDMVGIAISKAWAGHALL